jgi:hypothetical protein
MVIIACYFPYGALTDDYRPNPSLGLQQISTLFYRTKDFGMFTRSWSEVVSHLLNFSRLIGNRIQILVKSNLH